MKSGGDGVYHEDQYRSLSVSWVGIVQGNKEHLIVISWWKCYKPACAKWESAGTQIEVSLDGCNVSNCDHVATCWATLACSKLISRDRCAVPWVLKWRRMKRNCQRVACLLIFQYETNMQQSIFVFVLVVEEQMLAVNMCSSPHIPEARRRINHMNTSTLNSCCLRH